MFLYILYSEQIDKYYIGITSNLSRRLKEHNGNSTHYTGKINGSWIIRFSKKFKSIKEAILEEKRLKNAKNRKYLEWYINNMGP